MCAALELLRLHEWVGAWDGEFGGCGLFQAAPRLRTDRFSRRNALPGKFDELCRRLSFELAKAWRMGFDNVVQGDAKQHG
jgi:hypothetical protein